MINRLAFILIISGIVTRRAKSPHKYRRRHAYIILLMLSLRHYINIRLFLLIIAFHIILFKNIRPVVYYVLSPGRAILTSPRHSHIIVLSSMLVSRDLPSPYRRVLLQNCDDDAAFCK